MNKIQYKYIKFCFYFLFIIDNINDTETSWPRS